MLKLWIPLIFLLLLKEISCKIYEGCELGREMYERYHYPLTDISKLLCIVQWESAFNTAAVNKGYLENSLDYGVFQINDRKWCKGSAKPSQNKCGMSCKRFVDDDITDDVSCLHVIMKEHGFDEWMSYRSHCQNNSDFLRKCDITSRALNVGMKLNYEPKPSMRFNILHKKDAPNLFKIRLRLTSQPKGLKVNVLAKEAKLNFFSKFLAAHYKVKPFFSMHQYVT